MAEKAEYFVIQWKMGKMHVGMTGRGICRLSVNTTSKDFENELREKDGLDSVKIAVRKDIQNQLEQYLAGERKKFDIEFDIRAGTKFQKKVWHQLRKIPYGVTISYQDLANLVGGGQYARAVGNANGKNPIGIIIPCHRVIRKNGGLGGYTGGLKYKKHFLKLEGVQI
jgi:methylated-DNA-[protein]-cysteine S-methyltransferase